MKPGTPLIVTHPDGSSEPGLYMCNTPGIAHHGSAVRVEPTNGAPYVVTVVLRRPGQPIEQLLGCRWAESMEAAAAALVTAAAADEMDAPGGELVDLDSFELVPPAPDTPPEPVATQPTVLRRLLGRLGLCAALVCAIVPVYQAQVVPARRSLAAEVAPAAFVALLAPAVAYASGLPRDPAPLSFNSSRRVDHPIGTLGLLSMNDHWAHALAGAQVMGLTLAASPSGHCGRTVARGTMYALAAGALYELGAAIHTRHRSGPGYGFGWADQAAVGIGAVASGAGICALRRILRE